MLSIASIDADSITKSRHTAITRAIQKVGPAVVSINVEKQIRQIQPNRLRYHLRFFQRLQIPPEVYSMESSGSGVIISPDGFVMTNQHVIEFADKVTVTLFGGDEYQAEIIGSDVRMDLALLKLTGSDFPYAKLDDSDDLIIGEWVIALGNPFKLFSVNNKPSASIGIISATNMDFGMQQSGKVFQDMIQTDAAINPGNSGGPLINANGEVIGINTFIFSESDIEAEGSVGIGFAIPINRAKSIAEELRKTGQVDRDYYAGLTWIKSLDPRLAHYLNIPFVKGVVIHTIPKPSPAHSAGLKTNDIILTVNDVEVNSRLDFHKVILINDIRAGDWITLKIFRNGKYKKIKMKLAKVK